MKAEYKRHSGTDLDVVNAARVSFDKESDWLRTEDGRGYQLDPNTFWYQLAQKDVNLIQYLARGMTRTEWEAVLFDLCMRPDSLERTEEVITSLMQMAQHWAPFTHNSITLRMKAPIPIRTQCFKSKVGFTESEESRRYISSTPELFIPEFREAAENVKQGSGGIHKDNKSFQSLYSDVAKDALLTYEHLLKNGVAEEQARFILPQGVMVNWIWTGNLAAYARYFNLRYDLHAQKESQDLALEVAKIIEPLFPVSWKALTRPVRT